MFPKLEEIPHVRKSSSVRNYHVRGKFFSEKSPSKWNFLNERNLLEGAMFPKLEEIFHVRGNSPYGSKFLIREIYLEGEIPQQGYFLNESIIP